MTSDTVIAEGSRYGKHPILTQMRIFTDFGLGLNTTEHES